ncbi:S8 family serine peptidase [Catellatospora sp. NPDC049609]|uniref:S8 family serine peptidase n=1 Tax=Catellatospora sp. NPDC049609 TaxID=3155505 RepID=UPI0034352001
MNRLHRATLAVSTAFLVSVLGSPGASSASADQISEGQWFHKFLRTDEAHKITQGAGVVVAVVDSGVDATHPDLRGSVKPGADLTREGPGDGRVDEFGHGTGMAGLIAAHGRVRGVAPAATIMPVRNSIRGLTNTAEIASGIEWATAQGADVISVSLANDFDDALLREAVRKAISADIVVVASAGNKPVDKTVGYPAAIPGVLAVAGVGRDGQPAATSVSGAAVVISAPCDGITSTGLDHLWRTTSGTSDSTAIVSGAVALVRAKYPELSAADVIHRITATAVDKGPAGRDPQYGYGVLDIVAALTADVPPLASPTPSASANRPTEPDSNGSKTFMLIAGAVVIVVGVLALLLIRSRRRR